MTRLGTYLGTPEDSTPREFSAEVIGLREDGTVNLTYLGNAHTGIDALASYTGRKVGDLVTVRNVGDRWTVVGRVGNPDEQVTEITWGYGAPAGGGWKQVTQVWIKNGVLYAQRSGTAPTDGTDDSPLAPQEPVAPTSVQTYADDSPEDTFAAAQGPSPLDGRAWSTLWLYTDLATAVAAKPVRAVQLRLERDADDSYGGAEGLQTEVYLHGYTAFPPFLDWSSGSAFVAGPYIGPILSLGESAWWDVPAEAWALLVSAVATGFAVYTPTGDFIQFVPTSGDVKILN